MRINIMSKYQVKYKNKYSYRVENDVYNKIFKHGIHKWNRKMDGGNLIELIARLIQEPDFLDIASNENEIQVALFEPLTGEGADITIQYKRLEDKEEDNDK